MRIPLTPKESFTEREPFLRSVLDEMFNNLPPDMEEHFYMTDEAMASWMIHQIKDKNSKLFIPFSDQELMNRKSFDISMTEMVARVKSVREQFRISGNPGTEYYRPFYDKFDNKGNPIKVHKANIAKYVLYHVNFYHLSDKQQSD